MAFRYVPKTIGKLALAAATQVEHGSHTPSKLEGSRSVMLSAARPPAATKNAC